MKLATLAAAAALMILPFGAGAFAQTAAPAPAATPAPAASAPARSEKSIECSRQADAKGLHGEARRKFRAACKKGS